MEQFRSGILFFFVWLVNQLCQQVSSINRILKKIHLDMDMMSSAYPDVSHSYTGNSLNILMNSGEVWHVLIICLVKNNDKDD